MVRDQSPPSVREIVVVDEVCVVYVRSGPGVDVCGGKVGAGKVRFCMSQCEGGATSCRFASHSVKMDIPFPAYFIQSAKGATAFCEPCLLEPDEGFSEVIKSTLLGKRTLAEWTRIFPTITSANDLNEDQQLDMIARGERVVTAGPTPMKRRVIFTDPNISTESLSVDGRVIQDDTSQMSGQVYAEALVEPDTGYDDTLLHIVTCWNEVVTAGFKQLTLLQSVETNAQTNLEEIDDKIVQVSSTVGIKPLDCDLPLTLWSSISAVSEEVSACVVQSDIRSADMEAGKKLMMSRLEVVASHVADVQNVVETNVKPLVQMLSVAVKGLQNAAGSASRPPENISTVGRDHGDLRRELDEVKRSMGDMTAQIARASMLNQDLVQKVLVLERSSGAPSQGNVTHNRSVDELQSQIYSLRRAIDNMGNDRNGSSSGRMEASVGELAREMSTIRDQMSLLELDNARIRSEIVTDNTSFGGHSFMTEESYVDFVIAHYPKGQTHFLLDFISMCECASNRNRSTADGLKNFKMLSRAGFDSANEGTVFASFGTVFPILFGDEHDSKDATKKMGSMVNMKEWDPNTNRAGRKNLINVALTNFKRSTELQITSLFGQSSVPALFFKTLLQSTWSFWEALVSWITHFENEMASQMGAEGSEAQKAQIWNLVCWIIHSMFTEMEVRRAAGGVAQTIDKTDPQGRCAAILQGTLGGHKFMSELVDSGFSRHPLFAATMSEFLMTTKASVIVLEEVKAIAKSALVAVRSFQSEKDKKGNKGNVS